jgi:hypothetical protein
MGEGLTMSNALKIPQGINGFNGKGAVTTVNQSRIPIFSATRRPMPVVAQKVTTPWGEATITGRLGQAHCDFLETACETAIDSDKDGVGRIMLLLDMGAIRRGMGRNHTVDDMLLIARDLRAAEIQLMVKSPQMHIQTDYKVQDYGGILDEIRAITKCSIGRHPGAFDVDEAHPWRITFGRSWTYLMENDLPVFYRQRALITALRHGVSQALARWALTHEKVSGQPLEDVLGYLRYRGQSGRLRDRMAEVREDTAILAEIGVKIQDGRVFYTSPDVKIQRRKRPK